MGFIHGSFEHFLFAPSSRHSCRHCSNVHMMDACLARNTEYKQNSLPTKYIVHFYSISSNWFRKLHVASELSVQLEQRIILDLICLLFFPSSIRFFVVGATAAAAAAAFPNGAYRRVSIVRMRFMLVARSHQADKKHNFRPTHLPQPPLPADCYLTAYTLRSQRFRYFFSH